MPVDAPALAAGSGSAAGRVSAGEQNGVGGGADGGAAAAASAAHRHTTSTSAPTDGADTTSSNDGSTNNVNSTVVPAASPSAAADPPRDPSAAAAAVAPTVVRPLASFQTDSPSSAFRPRTIGVTTVTPPPLTADAHRRLDLLAQLRRVEPPIERLALHFLDRSGGGANTAAWCEISLPMHQINEKFFLYGLRVNETLVIRPDVTSARLRPDATPVTIIMRCDRQEEETQTQIGHSGTTTYAGTTSLLPTIPVLPIVQPRAAALGGLGGPTGTNVNSPIPTDRRVTALDHAQMGAYTMHEMQQMQMQMSIHHPNHAHPLPPPHSYPPPHTAIGYSAYPAATPSHYQQAMHLAMPHHPQAMYPPPSRPSSTYATPPPYAVSYGAHSYSAYDAPPSYAYGSTQPDGYAMGQMTPHTMRTASPLPAMMPHYYSPPPLPPLSSSLPRAPPCSSSSGPMAAAAVVTPTGAAMRTGRDARAKTHRGTSCHSCKNRKSVRKLAFCTHQSMKRTKPEMRACRKKYCDSCLRKFYNTSLPQTPEWVCPSCEQRCICAACVRHLQAKRKRAMVKGEVVVDVSSNAITIDSHDDTDDAESTDDSLDEEAPMPMPPTPQSEAAMPPTTPIHSRTDGQVVKLEPGTTDSLPVYGQSMIETTASSHLGTGAELRPAPAHIAADGLTTTVASPVLSTADTDLSVVSSVDSVRPLPASSSSSSIRRPLVARRSLTGLEVIGGGSLVTPLNLRRQVAAAAAATHSQHAHDGAHAMHDAAAELANRSPSSTSSSYTLSPLPSPNLALRSLSLASHTSGLTASASVHSSGSTTPISSRFSESSASPNSSPFGRQRVLNSFGKAPSPSVARRGLEPHRGHHPYSPLTGVRTIMAAAATSRVSGEDGTTATIGSRPSRAHSTASIVSTHDATSESSFSAPVSAQLQSQGDLARSQSATMPPLPPPPRHTNAGVAHTDAPMVIDVAPTHADPERGQPSQNGSLLSHSATSAVSSEPHVATDRTHGRTID